MQEFTIEVAGLTDEELEEAVMFIYASNGNIAFSTRNVNKFNQVKLIQGEYVAVVVVGNSKSSNYKITVFN